MHRGGKLNIEHITRYFLLAAAIALGVTSTSVLQAQESSGPATASPSPAAEQPAATFHANSRLVLVDVVVTGRDDQPIKGLKASDFVLLEDGKPQSIAGMEEHDAGRQTPAPPPIQLPPHQFTNFPVVASNRPITIVLLDTLNTQVLQEGYARKQMIAFLKSLPRGETISLFVLGTQLKMIQGFTGSSEALIAAANSMLLGQSPLVTSEADRQTEETITHTLSVNAVPASIMVPGASQGVGAAAMPGNVEQQLNEAFSDSVKAQENRRVETTLQGLALLAGAVSSYPGRKNLLWLSTNFPFRFGPDLSPGQQSTPEPAGNFQAVDRSKNSRNFESPFHSVTALLAAAQIAVYPIDIGGVQSDGVIGVDISTPVGSSPPAPDMRQRAVLGRWDTHEAMTDIAQQTGGEALYGSNDFKNMMQRSIHRGENYYTLAYIPANGDWSGKYRKLQVKLSRGDVKLEYRRGFYAMTGTQLGDDQKARLLAHALLPSVPQSTMLLIKVQVLPPDRDHKQIRIDYAVAPSDIAFTDAPDHLKHAQVDFIASVWSPDNTLVAHVVLPIDFHIRRAKYEEMLKTGIPAHQEIDLKPGKYTLRLGVMDRATQKIGTVDVPLTVAAKADGS